MKRLILFCLLFISCEQSLINIENIYYPEDLGNETYFIIRSDKALSFKIENKVYIVEPSNYELLIFSSEARPYVKTSDFKYFKIFSNKKNI